jgi:hypothetical protein
MNTRNRLALSSEKNDFARVLSAYLVLLKTRDTGLCKMELDGKDNSHEGVDCCFSMPPGEFLGAPLPKMEAEYPDYVSLMLPLPHDSRPHVFVTPSC